MVKAETQAYFELGLATGEGGTLLDSNGRPHFRSLLSPCSLVFCAYEIIGFCNREAETGSPPALASCCGSSLTEPGFQIRSSSAMDSVLVYSLCFAILESVISSGIGQPGARTAPAHVCGLHSYFCLQHLVGCKRNQSLSDFFWETAGREVGTWRMYAGGEGMSVLAN